MYGAMARLKEAPARTTSQGLYAAISGGEPLPAAVREAFTATSSASPFMKGTA